MLLEQAREFIINKINCELPAYFYYHNANHALDVYETAKRIALAEGISKSETTWLLSAALFHDAGFLSGLADHEMNSCALAREFLPGFEYSHADIERVCQIIMATKMPQNPLNKLGEIICDADLDYLGRNDFFILSKRLFSELVNTVEQVTKLDWDKQQIVFLTAHNYFTDTAKNSNTAAKKQHLETLTKSLFETIDDKN